MAELAELYASAQLENDDATAKCKQASERFEVELAGSKDALSTAERLFQGSVSRMANFQSDLERAQVDIETYLEKHKSLQQLCATKHQQAEEHLAQLMADEPVAHELVATGSAGCSGSPVLLECKVDGHRYTTFSDAGLRELITRLSVPSEQLAALALKRTASSAVEHAALLEKRHKRRRLRHVRRVRDESCEEVESQPKCEAMDDLLYTFYGNVIDAADEVREKMAVADRHCERTLTDYNSEVKQAKGRADMLNTELANAAASKIDGQEDVEQKKRFHDAAVSEADAVLTGCKRAAADAAAVMLAIKHLRPALLDAAPQLPPYEGDCEVSEWVAEPCSAPCNAGTQVLRREIISMPQGGLCPPLNRTQSCNEIPCPVDCQMGTFGDWSACSRPCGGGTRQHTRSVLQHAMHGGAACGDVLEQEVCNPQPCKTDCLLAEWSEWSSCSRSCGKGWKHRVRREIKPADGGDCAAEFDPSRYESEPCDAPACSDSAACGAGQELDVVVLVDASGSVGQEGLAAEQQFVQGLASRLGEQHLGVVVFGSEVTVAAELQPASGLTGLALSGDFNATDLAQGVAVARTVLAKKRPDARAKLLILMDGMPMSKHLAQVEISRAEAEVNFLVAGSAVNARVLEGWAPHPAKEHILEVSSFAEAAEAEGVTQVIAGLCPSLSA